MTSNRMQDGFIKQFLGMNEGRKTSLVPDEAFIRLMNVDLNKDGSLSRRVPAVQLIDFLGDLTYTPSSVYGACYFATYAGSKFIVFGIPDSTGANGKLYSYNFSAITALTGNFGTTYKYGFQTFLDKLYVADGAAHIIEWDGSAVPARIASATCPHARFLCEFKNYLFAAGDPSYPNTLAFSDLGVATTWPTVNTIMVGSDEEYITGLLKWGGMLIVFKQSSIWYVAGSSKSNFTHDCLTRDFGLIFPFACAADNSGVYLVTSSYELYRYNGTWELLSDTINTINDFASFNRVVVAKNKVIFIPDDSSEMYVWHKDRKGITKYDFLHPDNVDVYDFGYMQDLVEAAHLSDLGQYFLVTTKGIHLMEFAIPSMESIADNNMTGTFWREFGTSYTDTVELVRGCDDRFTTLLDMRAIMTVINKTTNTITAYYSLDNGNSWTASGSAITGTAVKGAMNLYKPASATSKDWTYYLLLTSTDIYRSTNAGNTWASVLTIANLSCIATDYDGTTTYILVGVGQKIYKSIDFGANWAELSTPYTGESIVDLVSCEGGIFVVATSGHLLVSADYGATWTSKKAATTLAKLAYAGSGMLICTDTTSPNTAIYISTDYGQTWTAGTVSSTATVKAIYGYEGMFFASLEGQVGDYGIYKSANNGTSWQRMNVMSKLSTDWRVNDIASIGSRLAASVQTAVSTPANGVGRILYQTLPRDVVREPRYGYKYFNNIYASVRSNILLDDSKMERQIKYVYIDGRFSSGTLKIYDRDDTLLCTKTLTGSSLRRWLSVKVTPENGFKVEVNVDSGVSNFVLSRIGIKYLDIREMRPA